MSCRVQKWGGVCEMQGTGFLFFLFSRLLQLAQDEDMFTMMPAGLSAEITLEANCFVEIFLLFWGGYIFVHIIAMNDLAG